WKYSWTKRLLILSDGKPGHVKQSEAVAREFKNISTQHGRPGMEYPTSTIEVKFKSLWHRGLFPWFAFFFIPWAQGRLRFLGWFFSSETQKAVENASADFIISAGASLVPLHLCLARDSRAKSIVLMKPSFPFHLFHYDLAMVPVHDRGPVPDGAFRTLLTPSCMEPERISGAAQKLARSLPRPGKVKLAVFLGGPTRRFSLELEPVRRFFLALDRSAAERGDYLVTTSRRTPQAISDFLKREIANRAHCQKVVIAAEDPGPETAPGMMALASIVLVTEDSISMISEAISAGRKVIVLNFGSQGLPAKHKKFREILARESAIVIAGPEDLEEKIAALDLQKTPAILRLEKEALAKRLQKIL
ncbi:MAG TPA: ELM1/GtrOC1 family putative glycosyltransferase, partial [Candidatus Paceibacterota bacterium]